ncbi:MAG: hypothetical protein V7731_17370 [Amphritea sp.]
MYKYISGFLLVSLSFFSWSSAVVRTAPLQDLLVQVEFSAPAKAVSYEDSILSAQISGQLLEVLPKVGEQVDQGVLLARIDCRDSLLIKTSAQANLASLNAQMRLATAQLTRAKQLQNRGNVSQERRDRRQAELGSLRGLQQAADVAL